MIKYFAAAGLAIFLAAAGLPSNSATLGMPGEKSFPSSVGEVIFRHQLHTKDVGIKCVECHHQIDAKKLITPHSEYFKSSWINCKTCHKESEKVAYRPYVCSECHHTKPGNIADETLSAKVVIHRKCWQCHQVGTGKEASKGCEKCHSGKKTL